MSPRNKRIAIALALITLIGGLGVALFSRHEAASREATTSPAAVAKYRAANVGILARYIENFSTRLPKEMRSNTGSATADATSTEPINANRDIDDGSACGVDKIRNSLDGSPQDREMTSLAHQAIGEATEKLRTSQYEKDRVLALVVQKNLADRVASTNETSGETINCNGNDACNARMRAASLQAQRPYVEALARLGANTQSAATFATAYYACQGSGVPACSTLTAARWAELDRDNAVPWLHLAHAAKARGDNAAYEQALLRASQATIYTTHQPPVLQLALSDAIQKATLATQVLATTELYGQFFSSDHGTFFTLVDSCRPPANDAPGRRDICGSLAEKLLATDSLVTWAGGMMFGNFAGWPKERIAALSREKELLTSVGLVTVPNPAKSCANAKQTMVWASDVLRFGEMAALRQRLATSNLTHEEMLEKSERIFDKAIEQASVRSTK